MLGKFTMDDKEVLQIVASAAAQRAAQEIVVELRQEIADQFQSMKEDFKTELARDLKSYFGRIQPEDHIVQHSKLVSLTSWFDEFQRALWSKIAMIIIIVACVSVGGFTLLSKAVGH